jgi:hypothetical protein
MARRTPANNPPRPAPPPLSVPVLDLPEPCDDQIRNLLDLADATAAWALALYANGPRDLTTKQGAEVFLTRRQVIVRLEETSMATERHDFGPRAPLWDVQSRTQRLRRVVKNIVTWAIDNRGRQPPAWTEADEAAAEEGRLPDWSADMMRAENQRISLWRELQSTKYDMAMLGMLVPQPATGSVTVDGPAPPCWLWWQGKRHKLSPLQWQLLRQLWDREIAEFEDVIRDVWGDEGQDRADSTVRSALSRLNALLALKQANAPGLAGLANSLSAIRTASVLPRPEQEVQPRL